MRRKSASNRRREKTPQHRRSSRRRLLSRIALVSAVLSALCALFALIFLVLSIWRHEPFPEGLWRVTLAYSGAAFVLLIVRLITARRPRTHKVKRSVHTPDPKKEGMVLILVLVLLGMMAALILHLQQSAYIGRQADARLLQQTRLRAALQDEGLRRIQALADQPEHRFHHAEQAWAETVEIERPDGITTVSRITDLNRYLDVNNLFLPDDFPGPNLTEDALIEAMTHAADFTPIERIEAIRDWIDPDDEGIRETAYYMNLTPPYEVPNAWMHTWHEFNWIAGFEPSYFEIKPLYRVGRAFEANITDLLTVIPGPRRRPIPVNINTADLTLLTSLGGSGFEELARFIQLRRAEQPFETLETLLARVDESLFTFMRPFLAVRSTHFIVEVQAIETPYRARLRALLTLDDEGEIRIRQWVIQ